MKTVIFFNKVSFVLTFFCTLVLQAQFTFDSGIPAAVANNIALDANIILNFSENVKVTSITAANIRVTGRYSGMVAGVFSGGGTSNLVFNPTANFKSGEVITVTLISSFIDFNNNIVTGILSTNDADLINPTSFSFTTKSGLNASTPSWTENTVYQLGTSNKKTTSVFAADMDNDGDLDIISSNYWDYEVTLHTNDGSENPSWTSQSIDMVGFPYKPRDVFAADMDNDGYMDIIAGYANEGLANASFMRWYKNNKDGSFTGGSSNNIPGDFGSSSGAAQPIFVLTSVFVADMDNDGDMDVLSSAFLDAGNIGWYKNNPRNISSLTAGFGRIKNDIDTGLFAATSVFAADMDNDGDMDVIAGSEHNNKLMLYKNNGSTNPSFDTTTIVSDSQESYDSENGSFSVFAADIDNDGDLDILSSSKKKGTIALYKNNGLPSSTWVMTNIDTGAIGVSSVTSADMDNDGDLDVIVTSQTNNSITWYENIAGDGSTWSPFAITLTANEPRSVFIADIDGDGDMDVLAADFNGNKINWYENSSTTEDALTNEDHLNSMPVNVYKGEGNNFISIEGLSSEATIKLYNILGEEVRIKVLNAFNETLSTKGLGCGIYIIQLNLNNQLITRKIQID
jgi:hypothetical protein